MGGEVVTTNPHLSIISAEVFILAHSRVLVVTELSKLRMSQKLIS